MSDVLNIPRKVIIDLQKEFISKFEMAGKNMDDAEEDINQLEEVIENYEDIIDSFEKRKGYDSIKSGLSPVTWRSIHKKDDDVTPEEYEALTVIKSKRRQLASAQEQYRIESEKVKAYLDIAEQLKYLLNY